MRHAWTAVAITTMMLLAGCTGRDDDHDDDDHHATDSPQDRARHVNATLEITRSPSTANASQSFSVRWTVALSDANVTSVNLTALRWGNDSASTPTLAAYPFAAGARTDVAPGTFDASLTVNWTGTIRLRAMAMLGNRTFWSNETTVNVVQASIPVGAERTVSITLGGPSARYNPSPLTIKRGDTVQWDNDDLAAPHSATSDAGASFSWDTGTLQPGASSDAVQFTKTGTFGYYCKVHPNSMSGSITVTA